MVEDLNPAGDSNAARFLALGSIVLFVADDGVLGPELHRSDGTAAGTFLVEEIVAGPGGISVADVGFAVLAGALVFNLDDGVNGAGAVEERRHRRRNVAPRRPRAGRRGSPPPTFARSARRVLFSASTTAAGFELFVTDGTAPGTTLLATSGRAPQRCLSSSIGVVGGKLVLRGALARRSGALDLGRHPRRNDLPLVDPTPAASDRSRPTSSTIRSER